MNEVAPLKKIQDKQTRMGVSHALSLWTQARAVAFTQFERQRRVAALWKSLSDATDNLLKEMTGGAALPFAVAATGGYGRGQLFPFSDIDVLILVPEESFTHPALERILYGLWDVPIKVGHAVRTPNQAVELAGTDHTVCASMMDMRYVSGDRTLYQKAARKLSSEVRGKNPLWFVEEKLRERDVRHKRALDSRFVLEPNVKEGKGALRDLHTIWWLARYCYNVKHVAELPRGSLFTAHDAQDYSHALMYIATVRASLHLLAGRADDRLTFDTQLKLSQVYSYRKSGEEAAARFMKHYFHHATRVGELTRSFCTLLEEENKRTPQARISRWLTRTHMLGAFEVVNGRLLAPSAKLFKDDPLQMVEIFALAQEHTLDIHPTSLKWMRLSLGFINRRVRASSRANLLMKQILLSANAPDVTLRRMSEAGILQRILPEFSAITGQMQYDRYHTYTVDEHTLKAIEILHAIEQGNMRESIPLASVIIGQIQSRLSLYMAMLTHDIGKGVGKQAERGEALSDVIARRMECSDAEVETISWLVRNHLLMSEVAFKRDLDDPKTIEDFVDQVQSIERLRLLLLVTVADIHAVGPQIWNGWKGALLRDVYHRAYRLMGGEDSTVAAQELTEAGGIGDIAPAVFFQRSAQDQQMLAALYTAYRSSQIPQLHVVSNMFHAICELTLCTKMTPQLLHHMAGVSALMGASIVSAKWMVTRDDVAWITVALQDATGAAFNANKALQKTLPLLEMVRAGTLDLAKEVARQRPTTQVKRAMFDAPARVMVDNNASETHSVIEINGHDRIGLLHDITAALEHAGVVVATAHVATYAHRVVDVFYVKDMYGHKLHHRAKRDSVEQVLMDVLTQ